MIEINKQNDYLLGNFFSNLLIRRVHWETEENEIIELKRTIELKISYILYVVYNHVSHKLVQNFIESNDFPREKIYIFFLSHENELFMIPVFVLLILNELQKLYALCSTDLLIVRK